jgi:hypothetical protein
MDSNAACLGADFELWQQLTDDYEEALQRLAHDEPGSRERVVMLSLALRSLQPELAPPGSYD